MVVDCRPVECRRPRDVAKFDATARACALAGWEYRLLGARPVEVAIKVTSTAGLDQQPAQPRGGQSGGLGRGGRGGQDGARIGTGQPAAGQVGERDDGGRVEVFEQVADLVADLLARPHGVLLGAGQHPDGLGQVGVGGRCAARSVRKMLASRTASVASDLAPDTAYRAR